MQLRTATTAALALILSIAPAVASASFRDDRRLSDELDRDGVVETTPHLRVVAQRGSLDARDLHAFAASAEKGILDIARFTGIEAPPRTEIYLSDQIGVSHTFPHFPGSADHAPRLFIDSERVAHRTAPYLHELVHAVVGDGDAMWLEEGYASWVASAVATRYGGYYAPVLSQPNDRVDAQAAEIVRSDTPEQLERELDWMRGDSEPHFALDAERTSFYVLSHSFTKFLALKIGKQKLTEIHRANDVRELGRRTGKTASAWRDEWLTWLKAR